MSSYVVLARKWRPKQFSDVVGQNHIVRTLINAIRSQRIHQAYLFTGSRGIGKTSIARIFAKVLRCEQIQDKNGIPHSCDECASCKEVTQGNSMDVIEIDGASNNGVEAIREIRENAVYMPATGKHKIYIIDEVHMLTTAAFNALLKTLEEPPAHVIFIFATTEAHKIPATILSRCQRFDYRRVTLTQIQTRLEEVIQDEKITSEEGALSLIARAAEGSMRDALSLLDQSIAFSGTSLSIQSVRESIGLIEGQSILEILKNVFNRKPLEALQRVDQVFQQGHDLRLLTKNIIEFIHATLLAKIGAPKLLGIELSNEEWSEIQLIAQLKPIEEIELIFQVLSQGMEWISRSSQPKIVLDVLLIKCASAEALITLDSGSTSPLQRPTTPTPTPRLEQVISPSPEKTWENFIGHVKKSRPLLASLLENASNNKVPSLTAMTQDREFTIYFAPENIYFREQLQSRIYQEQLANLTREYFGSAIHLKIELKNMGESLTAKKAREKIEHEKSMKEKIQQHPIILEAKSLFGGELTSIDLKGSLGHAANST